MVLYHYHLVTLYLRVVYIYIKLSRKWKRDTVKKLVNYYENRDYLSAVGIAYNFFYQIKMLFYNIVIDIFFVYTITVLPKYCKLGKIYVAIDK